VEGTIDTLKLILSRKGPKGGVKCVVLITHLGRPGAGYKPEKYSLKPVVPILQELLPQGTIVRFLNDCIGPEIEAATKNCDQGTVFLCENLRFHPEETAVDEKGKCTPEDEQKFKDALTRLGDVYCFEAFGAAHRPHASVVGINLPVRAAGLLMQKEMNYYGQVLGNPARPFLAILGGSKVSDKIKVIDNMLDLVDEMIIAGGMAYTFKRVLDGVSIGKSLFDEEGAKFVEQIVKKARDRKVKIHLPFDHVIGSAFKPDALIGVTDDKMGVPSDWMALDIGPKSRALFSSVTARAKTILWNGPLGVYEFPAFAAGTVSCMADMVTATRNGATTIVGGGDTGAASKTVYFGRAPVSEQVSWVSTGGGSSLVLMEGKMLPAIHALSDKPQ